MAGDEAVLERRLRRLASCCAVPAAAVLVAAGTIGWTEGWGAAGGSVDWMASPPAESFLAALAGLLLVLLSSGAYGRILRRPETPAAEPDGSAGTESDHDTVATTDGVAGAETDGARGAQTDGPTGVQADGGRTAEPDLSSGTQRDRGASPNDGAATAVEPWPPGAWAEERLRAYSRATAAAFAMLALAAGLGALVAFAGRAPLYGLVICLASLLGMAARWPRRSGLELALEGEPPARPRSDPGTPRSGSDTPRSGPGTPRSGPGMG